MLLASQLSQEQKEIIATSKHDANVQVIASPGTGKTAVALNLIQATQDDTLIIMYNASLSESTNNKVLQLRFFSKTTRKIQVHTYHSLLSSITHSVVEDDLQFIEVMNKIHEIPLEPWALRSFSTLIIDEAQDIRPLYFWLIKFLITHVATNPEKIRFIALGQPKQLLYGFYSTNRADERFLLKMDVLLQDVTAKPWKMLTMSRSYRMSPQIAATLNLLFPTDTPIIGCNQSGPPVAIHVCSTYKDVVRILIPYLPSLKPESDVFLLCPSANANSPLIKVVDAMVSHGLKVHVTRSGTLSESCPRSVLSFGKNKLKAMTFHASKGLESKTVIVINTRELFDGSNSLFVALSRAGFRLIIAQEVRFVTGDMLKTLAALSQPENMRIVVHRNVPSKLPSKKTTPTLISTPIPTPTGTISSESKSRQTDTGRPNEEKSSLSSASVPMMLNDQEELGNIPETYGTIPSSISIHELFAFVDVEHITELLGYVNTFPLQAKLEVSVPEPIKREQRDDDYLLHFDRLKNEQFGSYSSDMIVTVEIADKKLAANHASPLPLPPAHSTENQLHMNVLSYVGDALKMAVEFMLRSSKLPHLAYKLSLCIDPSHSLYAKMSNAVHSLQSAMYDFSSKSEIVSNCSQVEHLLTDFACLAAIHDAVYGFADRCALIDNYHFMMKPSVFMRFNRFFENIKMILGRYSPRIHLGFNEEHKTHIQFYLDDNHFKSIEIKGFSTISIGDKACILVIHSPNTSTNDVLAAASMIEVANVRDAYLVNIFDGSAVQLTLNKTLEFLSVALSGKLKIEPILSDEEFIKLHKAHKVEWDHSEDFVFHDEEDASPLPPPLSDSTMTISPCRAAVRDLNLDHEDVNMTAAKNNDDASNNAHDDAYNDNVYFSETE